MLPESLRRSSSPRRPLAAVRGARSSALPLTRVGALAAVTVALVAGPPSADARTLDPDTDRPDPIAERTAGMESQDGFIPVHVDAAEGQVLLEVDADRMEEDILYQNTLASGVGTNSPLLDRGQTGQAVVVHFKRSGPHVLMVRPNISMEAQSEDPDEMRAVDESFPSSTLAALPVEEEDGDRLLVDATEFLLSDVYDVGGSLEGAGQASSANVDPDRSYVVEEYTRAFPENTEVRSSLTLDVNDPGFQLNRVTPDGEAVTIQQQHSFVALPEDPMPRRDFDPRSGMFSASFWDFSQGLDDDYRARYTARWNLVPSDPEAYMEGELVEPEEPIVFYLDPGVPEPYRTAFIEGGLWWDEIYEAAGFENAFQIEELPEDADPMDARYSVIQWIHRTEPGPSVGPSYRDPRTGEILKAAVRMDSHRSLVNYNIYRGLVPAMDNPDVTAEEFAMARRRQHSAHEIGHVLGVAHNFMAASQGRSSVMDYPFPLVDVDEDGELDLTEIYREGGGAHDSLAIEYSHRWFPDEDEAEEELEAIIQEGVDEGLRFITGGDASAWQSHPDATQWVEGSDMMEALDRTTRVRRVLLENFDETAIDEGEPMSVLNQRLAHVYLHHRYALEGAVKYVGGMEFAYALRGDGQDPTRIIPAQEQREALSQVLAALEPDELVVPEPIPDLIPPSAYGWGGDEIWLDSDAPPALDPLTLGWSLTDEVVGNLLDHRRAARVVSFHARDPNQPSLGEVLDELMDATWGAGDAAGEEMHAALRRVAQRSALDGLLDLAGHGDATAEVRAIADSRLDLLAANLEQDPGEDEVERAHRRRAVRDIERYFAGEDDPADRPRPPYMNLPWP